MTELFHPVFGTATGRKPEASEEQQDAGQHATTETPVSMPMDDLRAMVECGRIHDTIVLDGVAYGLATLSDEDQQALLKMFGMPLADNTIYMEWRRAVVAMAMESVNGRPVLDLYPESAPPQPDAFGVKLAIARKLQMPVVDKLFKFYNSLLERSQRKVDPEQVKN